MAAVIRLVLIKTIDFYVKSLIAVACKLFSDVNIEKNVADIIISSSLWHYLKFIENMSKYVAQIFHYLGR